MNIHAKNLTKNLILAASKDDNSCVEQERMHHLIYCNAIKITAREFSKIINFKRINDVELDCRVLIKINLHF